MELRIFSQPSEEQVKKFGKSAPKRMQDQYAIWQGEDDNMAFAGIDFANNYEGPKTVRYEYTAENRKLPKQTDLLPAEVGSTSVKSRIEANDEMLTGAKLIEVLNLRIRQACADIGIIPQEVAYEDREAYLATHRTQSLTGYVGHVLITKNTIAITSVGDVFIDINGERKAGIDKEIDSLKKAAIDRLAKDLSTDRQKIHELMNPNLTLLQFQTMQNNPDHPLGYSAIDGTHTIAVQYMEIARKGVEHILIYTDGMKPKTGTGARTIDELTAVNAKYGEQTALELTDLENPKLKKKKL